MRAFSILSSLLMLEAALAAPFNDHASGGNTVAATRQQPVQAQAVVAPQLLPRVLSRNVEGSLPNGHRPSDLGADRATKPSRRSIIHREEIPEVKRHDHIASPNMTTSDSCNGTYHVSPNIHLLTTLLVGQAQCCQTLHQTQGRESSLISSVLGIVIPADNTMLGLQCTPLANLLSLTGSSTCNSKPVCCTGNE